MYVLQTHSMSLLLPYVFLIISLLFPYHFPIISLLFPNDLPMIYHLKPLFPSLSASMAGSMSTPMMVSRLGLMDPVCESCGVTGGTLRSTFGKNGENMCVYIYMCIHIYIYTYIYIYVITTVITVYI